MRIAQVAPLYEPVPPRYYGGTERVVGGLCDALVEAGHDVTLFASGDSTTRARLSPGCPRALRTVMSRQELVEVAPHLHLGMLTELYRRAGEFDVIHAHTDLWTLPFVDLAPTVPTVLTLHGRLDLAVVRSVFPRYPHVPLVSISDAQRQPMGDLGLRWMATVHNGLPVRRYPFVAGDGAYLAFVGRLCPEKAPDRAVEIAARAGLPLKVAAKIDPFDVDHWEDEIRPLFDAHDVEFVGELDDAGKAELMGGALATLCPGDWPEPFGLVMVESMACGTPVVALRRGSIPEVVEHGSSGFVCDGIDEMVAAVGRVGTLDRRAVRQRALRFDCETMARGYEAVYAQLTAATVLMAAG